MIVEALNLRNLSLCEEFSVVIWVLEGFSGGEWKGLGMRMGE